MPYTFVVQLEGSPRDIVCNDIRHAGDAQLYFSPYSGLIDFWVKNSTEEGKVLEKNSNRTSNRLDEGWMNKLKLSPDKMVVLLDMA